MERNLKGLLYQLMTLFKKPNSYSSLIKVPAIINRQQDSRKHILDQERSAGLLNKLININS